MAGQPDKYTTNCTRDRDTNERRYEACCGCTVVAPEAPTPYYPENGQGVNYSSVWLYWDPSSDWGTGCPTNNNRYKVYVGTTNPPTTLVGTLDSATTNYNFTGNSNIETYYWRIGATNGKSETFSGTRSFTQGIISGQVFEDPNREASLVGGVCTLDGASPVQPGAGSQVVVDSTYTGAVSGSGSYSVAVPSGSGHVAVLSVDPNIWTCTCPADCSYGTESPKSGLNYFVTSIRNPWFQVTGGSLHANAGNVASEIPSTCTGSCKPYLIRADAGGAVGLVSYTGSLSLGDVSTTDNVSQTANDWRAQSAYDGPTTGYDYFARILQDDPNGIGTWSGGEPAASGVYAAQGVTRTGGTDWNISGGKVVVILADGDLVIDNNINVAPGSFLAIIASGNLTVADAVTNVEGVFIADGDIATCESATCGTGGLAEQFTGEGIFVGWTGIELRRDFAGSANNTNPAETFTYRPDLEVNAHQYLLNPKYTWQEVAP